MTNHSETWKTIRSRGKLILHKLVASLKRLKVVPSLLINKYVNTVIIAGAMVSTCASKVHVLSFNPHIQTIVGS